MKALKKAWIFLLLVCLAALFSTTALADDATSGTCGDNLTWVPEDGVLTISGTGEMDWPNSNSNNIPWKALRESIVSVVIEPGVTTIGFNAFFGCANLTSAVIPDSVTDIGGQAFYGCSSLTSITIPDSVASIGEWAFSYCSGLIEIQVASGNPAYCAVDGVLFNKAKTELIYFPDGTDATSYTIPDTVTDIASDAFRNCRSLVSVTIPDSVTSIGSNAFNNTAYYNDSTNWKNDVLYIDQWIICADTSISGNCAIKTGIIGIANSAFNECKSLTSVTIPDSVTSIGNLAFYGCSSLTSITVGIGVTSIGKYAFLLCSALTDVYYAGSEGDWNAIEIGSINAPLTSATIHYNSVIDTGDADDEPTATTIPGDLNGDGEVDASDLTVLARHVGKVETMEDETCLANADVTGDGSVDASDLTKLAQYVGKIISSLD